MYDYFMYESEELIHGKNHCLWSVVDVRPWIGIEEVWTSGRSAYHGANWPAGVC